MARRVWQRKGLSGWLLWLFVFPVSLFYSLAVRVRNLLYSIRWMPIRSLPCAVVSVGNLTVGGTGKTPTTLWLARELGRRGYRVAILSRGYKRTGNDPVFLPPGLGPMSQEDDSFYAGDEPVMMARLYDQRVGVGKKRYEVGNRLFQTGEIDLFLLDDGFQHRRLKRDLDILVLGADWRGSLIPAGPFREPKPALCRADFYLVTGAGDQWESLLVRYHKKAALFYGSLQPKALVGIVGGQRKEYPVTLLGGSKIAVVSGIAHPEPFYRMIHDFDGQIVQVIEFPDHHRYTANDWQRINRVARNADLVVTTEKDLLKLARFPFTKEKLLALRVEMAVENGGSLVRAVEEAIQRRQRQS
ncbi:MAG: tetraacyldisaccharide 4'-kinase [Candidatus Binatia bacterium]